VRALPLVLVIFSLPLGAQDGSVDKGYDYFYNLDFDEAISSFQEAIARNPASPDLHNHVAEAIVFREMFRNGALESELVSGNNSFLRRPKLNPTPEIEKQFLDEIARAMTLGEAQLKANPNDRAAMYALGISYGLRSDYYWVVRKAWRDSLKDATAARKLHNRLSELDPSNVDARLVQGLHDYIVGSLPLMYRMLGFLVGIRGDREKGLRTVQEVATHGRDNRTEAQILLCALYRRENRPKEALPLIQDLIRRFPRNFLLRLELSQMYSLAGDGVNGLKAAEEVAALKSRHAPGYDRASWERIYYQLGTTQFWYRDLDRALENLLKVVHSPAELDLNIGSYAWLRIGQVYDMTRQRSLALPAYRKSIDFAPEGDAAREAKKYLSTAYSRP
jgi:tetratricopeptide (TPR) repeat protein